MILSKAQAVEEAKMQKKALATMGTWRLALYALATCLAVLAFYGIRNFGWLVPGIIAAVLAGVSLLLAFTVNLSIRNGHRNVERILASLNSQERSAAL